MAIDKSITETLKFKAKINSRQRFIQLTKQPYKSYNLHAKSKVFMKIAILINTIACEQYK